VGIQQANPVYENWLSAVIAQPDPHQEKRLLSAERKDEPQRHLFRRKLAFEHQLFQLFKAGVLADSMFYPRDRPAVLQGSKTAATLLPLQAEAQVVQRRKFRLGRLQGIPSGFWRTGEMKGM